MNIVSKLVPVILLFIVLGIIISCTDSLDKTTSYDDAVRIEYSDCSGCYECIDQFDCPENAIKKDPLTGKAYIDADLCVQCMECINVFQCPENAFRIQPDLIPPAAVTQLSGYSPAEGTLYISFVAAGDDSLSGRTYKYEISLTDENSEIIETGFEPPLPFVAGYWEYWEPIDSLPAGENVIIHITAIDEAGNRSAEATAQVQLLELTAPAAITDLSVESVSTDEITLTWTAVGDNGLEGSADNYTVKIDTNPITETNWNNIEEYPNDLVPLNSGEQEELIITGLDDNTTYYAAVKAVDDMNNISDISNIANATTIEIPDVISPASISDLDIEEGNIGIDEFMLSWTAVGDDDLQGTADSYIVKIHNEMIDENNWDSITEYDQDLVPNTAGVYEELQITGLDPLTEYFAAVKAVDEVNNISEISNIANAVTNETPDTDPPAAITDLTTIPTETNIELTWTAPGDDGDVGTAHHYEIKMHDVEINNDNWDTAEILPGPPWPLIAGSNQSYTVENLELNNTYFFAIRAFDNCSNVSEVSNSPFGMLLNDETPPADITNLSVYEGVAANLTTIKIQWIAPGDNGDEGICDHYEIRYALQPIDDSNWDTATLFNDPPDPLIAGTNQFCNVTDLNAATIYYFAIKAFDEVGNSNNISNSPAGKIVFQIDTAGCINCGNCINDCSYGAIHQGPGYKYINPDECTACGDCSCPWPQNYIHRAVVAY